MNRNSFASFALALLCLFGSADARPGQGMSLGSRGSHTWSPPPRTSLTPNWARPMDRTATPQSGFPNRAAPTPYGSRTPYGGSFPSRHPFMTGFMGGLLGAGIFGLLSGHGLFGGMDGGTSFLGFLFQVLVIGGLIVFLIRRFGNRPSSSQTNMGYAPGQSAGVNLTAQDKQDFRTLLLNVQAAWSAGDIRALSSMATPEMVGYFNEQLSNLSSRGARNIVSDVRFIQGDVSETWREGNLSFATVALRYSMIDVTTDMMGNVIDGSSTEHTTVTELWTFVRADGRGNWVLSAIQQAG